MKEFNALTEIKYFILLYVLVGYENHSMNIVIIYRRLANKCHDICTIVYILI